MWVCAVVGFVVEVWFHRKSRWQINVSHTKLTKKVVNQQEIKLKLKKWINETKAIATKRRKTDSILILNKYILFKCISAIYLLEEKVNKTHIFFLKIYIFDSQQKKTEMCLNKVK